MKKTIMSEKQAIFRFMAAFSSPSSAAYDGTLRQTLRVGLEGNIYFYYINGKKETLDPSDRKSFLENTQGLYDYQYDVLD